jgi:O-antigen/teichoic acid export membrane protein
MTKIFKIKSEFKRNIITMFTSTVISQAIPIAISPILTRIYSPEQFGLFALYTSIIALLLLISTGSYEMAIMLPKKDEDAKYMIYACLFVALFISMFFLTFFYFFAKDIVVYLGNEDILLWLYISPFLIIFLALLQSLNIWNSRKKRYKILANNKILNTSSIGVSQITFGSIVVSNFGLIMGHILGQIVSIITLLRTSLKYDTFIQNFKYKRMFLLMLHYKKFPLFTLPNSIVDGIRLAGINILINKYFSTAIFGQFSLAWRMVQAPASMITAAISPVLYQKTSTTPKKDLSKLVQQFLLKASLVSLPIFTIIYFFASDIFVFVFGEKWFEAGLIASSLTPWLFLNFLTSPISSIYIIIDKQQVMFIFSVVYMAVPLTLLALLQGDNFFHVIQIISIAMSGLLLVFIFLLMYFLNKLKG